MARAVAFRPVSMPNQRVWYGEVLQATSTKIVISDGFREAEYSGSFRYNVFGEVFGTLNAITEIRGGQKLYTLSKLRADANDAYYEIQIAGDAQAAAELLLRRADVMKGSSGGDEIRSYGGDDTIRGEGGGDFADGGRGDDRLFGNAGRDRMDGGSGSDFLDGGSHHDTLDGGDGRDKLRGGSGSDKISGGGDADKLFGNAGKDKLEGGGGKDRLEGGGGNDFLFGGGGKDKFRFTKGDDFDKIKKFEGGLDKIVIDKGASKFGHLEITQKHKHALIEYGDGDKILLKRFDADDLTAGDFIL